MYTPSMYIAATLLPALLALALSNYSPALPEAVTSGGGAVTSSADRVCSSAHAAAGAAQRSIDACTHSVQQQDQAPRAPRGQPAGSLVDSDGRLSPACVRHHALYTIVFEYIPGNGSTISRIEIN